MASSAVRSFLILCFFTIFSDALPSYLAQAQAGPHAKRLLFDHPVRDAIDVDGLHAWKAPEEGQQRGPCPGLNALANHAYISRDGIVSLAEVVPAANQVFGMGLDVAGLLSTLSLVFGGAPVSLFPRFSIAGESKDVSLLLNGLLGVTGMPQGLNLTHNIVEGDSSPTRNDLFETGDCWTMDLDKFRCMLDYVPDGASTEDAFNPMADFAAQRFDESIATNPSFYYGPVSGMFERNAAYAFLLRFYSNYSSEHPAGQFNHAALKSFFGVTGDGPNMTYIYGHERIPENFHRIPADYSMIDMNLDILAMVARHPKLASIGGNAGAVNTFTGVDIADLTGGVFNAANLLQGNNLICFALQTVKMVSPTFTNNLFTTLAKPLNLILDVLSAPLLSLECPAFEAVQEGGKDIVQQLQQYNLPGLDQGLF